MRKVFHLRYLSDLIIWQKKAKYFTIQKKKVYNSIHISFV